uniref:Cytochrome P450 n=1 Tax=Rhizophagus irregularis (strain DAOM 181602 / DAOM 197198 / MUCL 43194) TaxID=747089 RepID=U9TWW4_RHIID
MKLAANALTTILYLLAVHKDVQKKVRDEILRVLDDYLMPSVEQQKELKYMNIKVTQNTTNTNEHGYK